MGGRTPSGLSLLALLLSANLILVFGDQGTQYGLDMVGKASRGICWSEKLIKPYPNPDGGINYGTCNMNQNYDGLYQLTVQQQEQNIRKFGYNPKDRPDDLNRGIKGQMSVYLEGKLEFLPSKYLGSCANEIENPESQPTKLFSKLLGDSSGGAYPYKSLAHCLIKTLESTNGPKAVAQLSEHLNNPKPFLQDINDRENENRARHGVEPLKIDNELNVRAQRWADKLARDCKGSHHLKHVDDKSPDLQYQGSSVGENIHSGGAKTMATDAEIGVEAANGWYSEVAGYPWPYYDGTNTNKVIGHFTQQVWKDSKLVGYGIGRSSNCDQVFVVARYSPTGNMRVQMPNGQIIFQHKDNVMPPLY